MTKTMIILTSACITSLMTVAMAAGDNAGKPMAGKVGTPPTKFESAVMPKTGLEAPKKDHGQGEGSTSGTTEAHSNMATGTPPHHQVTTGSGSDTVTTTTPSTMPSASGPSTY